MHTLLKLLTAVSITLLGATAAAEPQNTETQKSAALIGKWEVSYAEMQDKAIYEIKEVDGKLQGYATAFIDATGNQQTNPDNTLILTNFRNTGDTTTATYQVTYEAETYDVETQLSADSDTINNQYNYYGYEGKETWKKLP